MGERASGRVGEWLRVLCDRPGSTSTIISRHPASRRSAGQAAQGHVRHEFGPRLEKTLDSEAGDFIFIEAGVPHEVFNLSDTEPVVAVVARSDAQEWENIVDFVRPAPE